MNLPELSAAATQGEWSVWAEPIKSKAVAIGELAALVEYTADISSHIYFLEAGGKCPAETGCGPTSEANAAFIVALVNAYRTGQLVERAGVVEALPADAIKLLTEVLREDWAYPLANYAADSGIPVNHTRDLLRAFHALGWAELHPFHSEDDNLIRGSGYSLSRKGAAVSTALANGSATDAD